MRNTTADLVFIPATALGHIMSTVEFANQLLKQDQRLSITFLIIKPHSGSVSAITTYIESLSNKSMERLRFIELPQDETPPQIDPKAPMSSVIDFINSHCKYVRKIVGDMMKRPGSSPIAGFVVDVFCTGMIDVANEFNVPSYVYYTSNAAFLGCNLYIQTLYDTENQDVVDVEFSKSNAEFPVPSFVKPVPTKVFPAFYRTEEGPEFLRNHVGKLKEAKAIMVNTFLELETHAINSFSLLENSFPPVYPVGPILNLHGVAGKTQDSDVISWLDGQPPSSVVFLCFGSMGSFKELQVKEIAHALERSGHRFLWSLRRPPPPEQTIIVGDYEDFTVVLPEGFLKRTVGVGKVIGWAPQVAILGHPAIGGFVSHCGWNSVLESLWFGVPLATWPMHGDQQLNAFELVVEMGLAVEISLDYKIDVFNPGSDTGIITAEEIESGITRLMEDNNVRTKVKEMSKKSRAAMMVNGSSYTSIGCLVHEFLSNISYI